MKVQNFLLLIYFTSIKKTDSLKAPLEIISYDDISPAERQHLAYLDAMSKQREKRSGHSLLSIIGSGVKSKLGQIAHASAGASAQFSSSSSGHADHPPEHHHEGPDYDHKAFDFWTLNKSILNTLLQAVKAIKGATIALTGKLIKGSGYLVSAKGKLISHGGDAVSSLGKKIASSAVLIPHGSSYSSYSDHPHEGYHSEYGPPSSEDVEVAAPSAIAAEYGPPPPNYHSKYSPSKYSSYEDDHKNLKRFPSGILILKKIPGHHHIEAQGSEKIPDFKPLKPQPSSYYSFLANLMASSSHLGTLTTMQTPYEEVERYPPPTKQNFKSTHPQDLTLEHKSPTNFVQYFKSKPSDINQDLSEQKPVESDSIKPYDFSTLQSQIMNAETGYKDYNFGSGPIPNSFQSFSNDPSSFQSEFPPNFNSPFSTEFSQDPSTFMNFLEQAQLQDPRSVNGINPNPFLPTPLSRPGNEFPPESINRPRTFKRTPNRTQNGPKGPNNFDLIKSISFQLGPNGPVKI